MHVERRGGHWRGALELALSRGHALCEPVDRKGSALYSSSSKLRKIYELHVTLIKLSASSKMTPFS